MTWLTRPPSLRKNGIERGIKALPTSLGQALDNLEKDDVLLEALGDKLAKTYIAVRRSEEKSYRPAPPISSLTHIFTDTKTQTNARYFRYCGSG